MPVEKLNKLADVFGTSRDVPLSYVERKGLDDRFLNDLTRDKHVVIHGASKQGKTCLRKHHMSDEDYVVLQCSRDSTKSALYELLLKYAGVQTDVSTAKTQAGSFKLHATVSGEGKIPFLAKAGGEGGAEAVFSKESVNEAKDFDIDPNDANDVIRVLKAAEFKKYVVVEDFHYLDEAVQQALAFDLKVFHETSSIVFMIVGVWLESSRLTLYNGDLSGRIATLNADHWESSQLKDVIAVGCNLLGIRFPAEVERRIVDGCQGNVGLLQEVCYRLCEKYEVWNTQGALKEIGSVDDVEQMLRAVSEEQASRYRNFLTRFAEGLGETQLGMYKWIGYVVVQAALEELKRGLRPNLIFQRIRGKHPSSKSLQQNNVVQALERVSKVQFKHKLQPLIFDYSNGELVVVDANFLVFLQTHTKTELLGYLGFDE